MKPEVGIVAGKEAKHLTGYHALRYYEGPKLVFVALKNASPAEAEAKRRVKASRMSAVVAAREAGIAIKLPDPKRKTLATQLSQFLADTADRGSLKAWETYRLACDEFLEVIGCQFADEIEPNTSSNSRRRCPGAA